MVGHGDIQSKIVQCIARSFCTGDIDVTSTLLSEVFPPTGKAGKLWGATPTPRLARGLWMLRACRLERSVPLHQSGRETLPTTVTLFNRQVDAVGQDVVVIVPMPATSWRHVWELDVNRGPVQFDIPVHLSKAASTSSLQKYYHWRCTTTHSVLVYIFKKKKIIVLTLYSSESNRNERESSSQTP